jgi:hypothetical protein
MDLFSMRLKMGIVPILMLALLVLGSPSSAVAGKNSAAFTSAPGGALPINDLAPAATLTIDKGKPKRWVKVDVTVNVPGAGLPVNTTAFTSSLEVKINGVEVHSQDVAILNECGNYPIGGAGTILGCTHSATFWLDLDAAETANPGQFRKKLLTIDVYVTTLSRGGLSNDPNYGTLAVFAQFVKK